MKKVIIILIMVILLGVVTLEVVTILKMVRLNNAIPNIEYLQKVK